jgi:uncharacterized protein
MLSFVKADCNGGQDSGFGMAAAVAIDRRPMGAVMKLVAFAVAICALLTNSAFALTTPERNGWVTDQAGILDAGTAGAIATRLIDLQRNTGNEVVVVTLSSLQGASIETWGNLLSESWRVGRNGGNDTGVLLIVAPSDRKVRIAVGYGLGNRISDSVAAAIISDHILPYFRQGDFARGVKAGVDSIYVQLDRAAGTKSTDVERGAYPISVQQPSLWARLKNKLRLSQDDKVIAFWVLVFVVILIWMVLNAGNVGGRRRRGYYYDYYDYDSNDSWFSFGSSSGGSSSSAGGSSGSSGASSGGGSSGGGATGSW